MSFFKDNFSNSLLTEIISLMKEKLIGPGEILFKQGDEDKNIYFIRKGELELILENQKNPISYI
jgi:CRP-like cAMP-binding protein